VPKRENGRRLSKPERRQRQARMALSTLDEFMREVTKPAV
jgi:methylenetetrahydrofolate--tRNA-(uracil-5-)-methyltransferase